MYHRLRVGTHNHYATKHVFNQAELVAPNRSSTREDLNPDRLPKSFAGIHRIEIRVVDKHNTSPGTVSNRRPPAY
jgi:hypothetical protein